MSSVRLPSNRQIGLRLSEPSALLLALGVTSGLALVYHFWLDVTNPTIVALSFLFVVLIVATVSTRWVAVVTSLAAFLLFNFFFLPPVRTLTIADPQNWVALFTFLAVSIVASHLSSQVRRRAEEATARRDELARLFDLTRDILLTTETTDAVTQVARYVSRRFAVDGVMICLPGTNGWHLHRAGDVSIDADTSALDRVLASTGARVEFDVYERTYLGHSRVQTANGPVWLVPLRVGTRPIGLLAMHGDDIEPGTRDAIAGVTAIAIERTHLLEERKEAEVVRRGAELKSALLAALGHDLMTPLTAVTVAATNLDASWLTEEQRREQAEIVRIELARLNRLFQDIVDMARIETHAIAAEREWVEAAEIVEAAARQVGHSLARHVVRIEGTSERVLIHLDPRLTSAALAHLLENAAQYSPPGSEITVHVDVADDEFRISVRDRGRGIAAKDLDHLFERFYRGLEAREQRFGTGMGLAITRGLLAAQGGRVWAENHPTQGAVFTLAVPAENRPSVLVGGEAL